LINKRQEVLYIADANVLISNGNLARQLQFIRTLSLDFNVTVLNTGASPRKTVNWLRQNNIDADVSNGFDTLKIWLYVRSWYFLNSIVCIKLKLTKSFLFPPRLNARILRDRKFDLLVFFYGWNPLLINIKNPIGRIVVDLNDVMADRHARIQQRRWISFSARHERKVVCCPRYEPIAITKEDAQEFKSLYGKKPSVLPYSVASYKKHFSSEGRHVGFLGAKNNYSDDFIDLLLTSPLIEVLAKHQTKLLIAGNICDHISSETLDSLRCRGVKVIGSVDSIEDFYEKVHTVINLCGPSTGAKIKSIEALMHGKRLVSTIYGVDEYTMAHFKDLIVSVEWPLRFEELTVALSSVVERAKNDGLENADSYQCLVDRKFVNFLTKKKCL
jgi:hypothetical protein